MQLNTFFNNICNISGFLHWFVQRFSALLVIFFTLYLFVFFNVYLFCIVYFFLSLHMFAGVETLVSDYLHDDFKSI